MQTRAAGIRFHTSDPSTRNPQPATLSPQPSTLNPQPSTRNPQPKPYTLVSDGQVSSLAFDGEASHHPGGAGLGLSEDGMQVLRILYEERIELKPFLQ